MDAKTFFDEIYLPNIDRVSQITGIARSKEADQMMLTIAGQESGWQWRYQLKPGGPGADGAYPARGWWQFEKGGGVRGVLSHAATKQKAKDLCAACHVYPDDDDVWRALEGHDLLAVGFARLLLWTIPRALPTRSSEGWRQYIEAWRPGKPHPDKWGGLWNQVEQVL